MATNHTTTAPPPPATADPDSAVTSTAARLLELGFTPEDIPEWLFRSMPRWLAPGVRDAMEALRETGGSR